MKQSIPSSPASSLTQALSAVKVNEQPRPTSKQCDRESEGRNEKKKKEESAIFCRDDNIYFLASCDLVLS